MNGTNTGDPHRDALRAIISNAYYESRNDPAGTMETAADDAVAGVVTYLAQHFVVYERNPTTRQEAT